MSEWDRLGAELAVARIEDFDLSWPADVGITSYVRPTIQVRAGELHLMATEAEQALIDGNAPFYVRGGLVRPIVDDMPAAHGRTTKVARLAMVDANTIVDHLSRVADWVKWNVRKNGCVPADPPLNVAATIIARDGEWRLPRLAGVITTPTLRPDGTILSTPGYDPSTKLLLLDPPKLPSIPDNPTRDHALSALKLLDSLLDAFPFVDEASRSVALSALITPVVRGAMPVAPLHAASAPVAGSGKSYLVDLASAILTGERAPVIAAGRNEEETEKRLGAALLSGQPIVTIDNVNGSLGGDALCQLIERPVVSVRPLGVSKLMRIESRATTFATGNNIQLLGDMTRRVILCSLDPNMERPELRKFKFSPFERIVENRGKYVLAALTVVRAYIVAGCPDTLSPLASFEQWSRLVRSALVWLGRADPLATMERARSEDPLLASIGSVLTHWYDAVGSSERTSGKVKETAEQRDPQQHALIHGELHDALFEVSEGRHGQIDAKRLGVFLGRHNGRIVNGLKLQGSEDTHSKQKLWRVVKV
jgi:putative DNA primase/helicase